MTAPLASSYLPAEALVSVEGSGCDISDLAEGRVVCAVGELASDTPQIVTMTTTLNPCFSGILSNTVTVTGANNIININPVEDGLELAKKYGLPRDVRAFIAEHHGTSLVKHFYQQALEQVKNAVEVRASNFRYAGPRPQRKETAIVMLADSCEAAVRASAPVSIEELEELIRRVITGKISEGELNECDLTLSDLEQIQRTFVEMLQGVFHRRVEYPQANKEKPLERRRSIQPVSPAPLAVEPTIRSEVAS